MGKISSDAPTVLSERWYQRVLRFSNEDSEKRRSVQGHVVSQWEGQCSQSGSLSPVLPSS